MMPCAGSSSTIDALELGEERVAVAHARCRAGRCAALQQARAARGSRSAGACSPIRASGGWSRPCTRASSAVARLSAASIAGSRRRDRSPLRSDSGCPAVGLIFLLARKAQRRAAALRCDMTLPTARIAAEDRCQAIAPSTPSTDVAPGIGFARLGVVGGDMADFMAEREGELGLIVHQSPSAGA